LYLSVQIGLIGNMMMMSAEWFFNGWQALAYWVGLWHVNLLSRQYWCLLRLGVTHRSG
jgi:hypothetical protein